MGYDLVSANSGLAATVYVYPAPSLTSVGSPPDVVADARSRLCAHEFERRKMEVLSAHPDARLLHQGAAVSPAGAPPVPGLTAAFVYDGMFAQRQLPLHSELSVFCYVGEKWTIEYRFTFPQAESTVAAEAIPAFTAQLRWPVTTRPD